MLICPECGLQYEDGDTRCFVDGAALKRGTDPWIGRTLAGRYLIEGPLASGGMATVYRARHVLVDRPVAIKIMAPSLARDPSLRERFRREAKNAAALAHPNIVEIFDYGEVDRTVYLVMELLDGRSLGKVIEGGPLAPARVIDLGIQIMQGLARAHDFGVIHRDLKPENILVTEPQRGRELVKLLDFGIARSMHDSRITTAGELFGTPQYIAPERIMSIDAGASADLYAVGCILFEMLAGRPPFVANEVTAYLLKHLNEEAPKLSTVVPGVPRRLEALVVQLLEKAPEARPVDAHHVIKSLLAFAPHSTGLNSSSATLMTREPSPTLPPTTFDRWERRVVILREMLSLAFPQGVPPEPGQQMSELRQALASLHRERESALSEQRKLEGMEETAREARGRLGFAVQSLGEDLSRAREELRAAKQQAAPFVDENATAEAAYVEALSRAPMLRVTVPEIAQAEALRDVADTLQRWSLCHASAQRASAWVNAKQRDVTDLEFQVQALRSNLEASEARYEESKIGAETAISQASDRAQSAERALVSCATRLSESLRASGARLDAQFRRLEQDG